MPRASRAEPSLRPAAAESPAALEPTPERAASVAERSTPDWSGDEEDGHGAAGAAPGGTGMEDDRPEARLHGDLVREVQRMWIIAAVANLACERGAESLTVREIIERAGVSRRRFYELFDSSRDCFEAAFEEAIAKGSRHAIAACAEGGEWAERLRHGLLALLSFFDSEPELTRLSLLGTATASPRMLARRKQILAGVAEFVDEGRGSVPEDRQPPALTAEALVGGALSVIQARLLDDSPDSMVELLNPLVGLIVLAYRGPEQARRELEHPAPQAADPVAASDSHHSVALDMRLTYRTLRVLAEIAARPGISNRGVGEAAGVPNAGQISKLLARLERHGLIRNVGAGQPRGAPNAWTLTPMGAKVDRARRLVRGGQMGD